jgi:hypothetical protein
MNDEKNWILELHHETLQGLYENECINEEQLIKALIHAWEKDFDFCTCGRNVDAMRAIYEKLYRVKNNEMPRNNDDHLLSYFLHSVGYTEHGGGIYGSWVSGGSGETFLWILDTLLKENTWLDLSEKYMEIENKYERS